MPAMEDGDVWDERSVNLAGGEARWFVRFPTLPLTPRRGK